MQRLHILISAHELSPCQGSECAEGWNLVTRIAKYHDLTVLYARGSQFAPDAYEKAIHQYFTENKNEYNINFIAIPQPFMTLWLASLNKKLSRCTSGIGIPILYSMGYRLWQKQAFKYASSCCLRSPVSLIHHLTSINFREPGYLWKLPVPFVWGPTGGTLSVPKAFYPHIGCRQALFEFLRSISNKLTIRYNRRVNQAIRKSSLIYSFSKEDQELFQKKGAQKVKLLLDAGCSSLSSGLRSPASGLPSSVSGLRSPVSGLRSPFSVHVLWVGQLVRRKALDILLRAVAGDPELKNNMEITVVGDGPLRKQYETLARNLMPDIRYPITFTGWLPREQVFERMKQADVLVHTSYREATSNVIPEALSCGLPVICHDISGMAIAVTDECGIKVSLVSYDQSVAGFRKALHVISTKLSQCAPSPVRGANAGEEVKGEADLRTGAFSRAVDLSWDSMAERIANDYESIANQS